MIAIAKFTHVDGILGIKTAFISGEIRELEWKEQSKELDEGAAQQTVIAVVHV
jgi:hypothetical protein